MKKDKQKTRKKLWSKLLNVGISIAIGLLKATPIGHILAEIRDNLKSKTGGEERFDWLRLVVYGLTLMLVIAKLVGWIDWDDLGKFANIIISLLNNIPIE